MPIDFPSSPTTNQTYTYNNKVWVYSGTAWVGGTVISALPAGSMQMYAGTATQTVSAGVVTTTAPSGWLLANGNAISRTTYSSLFSAIGTTYGTGDGSTTFNLPDLRGRLPMGAGTGVGLNASGTGVTSGTAMTARALGAWFGEETHLLTTAELASHTHANTVSGGSTGSMSANASHTHDIRMRADNSIVSGNYVLATSGTSVTYNSTSTGGTNGGGAGNGDGKSVATNTDHTHTFTPSISNASAGSGSRHDTIPPCVVVNYLIKI
jgi:microcystin-dependent protein